MFLNIIIIRIGKSIQKHEIQFCIKLLLNKICKKFELLISDFFIFIILTPKCNYYEELNIHEIFYIN